MQVHNVECQLAQAQMNLYLAGDAMDEDTVAELERHVAACESCRTALVQKKRSLQSMLKVVGGPDIPASNHAVTELRIERPKRTEPVAEDAVPAALRPSSETAKAPLVKNWKPIIYSGALAIVLVAMSFLGDPTKLLGGKANQARANQTSKSADAAVTDKSEKAEPKKAPETEAASANAEAALTAAKTPDHDVLADQDEAPMSKSSEGAVATYAAKAASEPEPSKEPEAAEAKTPKEVVKPVTKVVREPAAKKSTVRAAHPIRRPLKRAAKKVHRQVAKAKPRPKAKGGGIRVYDPSGKPISVRR
jgi:hypothetical protein